MNFNANIRLTFQSPSVCTRTRVRDDCDCQCSFFMGVHVCFNDLLMDDCLSSERGFLAHLSVQPFPCLRFRFGLSPFWSSPSLFQSISSQIGPHTSSLLQCLFEFSMRINVLKRKGLEEAWQACVTAERFTWGHKSQGERRGDTAHIKGSACGDWEVNWPSKDEGRTAYTYHLQTLPFPPCPLVSDFLALDKLPPPNYPPPLSHWAVYCFLLKSIQPLSYFFVMFFIVSGP